MAGGSIKAQPGVSGARHCSTDPSEPLFVFPLPHSLQLLAKNSCISAKTLSIAGLSIQ